MGKWAVAIAALSLGTAAMAIEPQATPAQPQATPASPQAPADLTLKRVFASPDLNGSSPRAARLSPDGKWLTLLRNRPEERDRYDLWAMDTGSGEWRMLVDSAKLSSGGELSEAEKMQRERARIGGTRGIVAYDWAPDGKSILVPLDGELYRAGLDGTSEKLPAGTGPKLNPEISPRGTVVSYIQNGRLMLLDQASGKAVAATPEESSETVHWGEAEFVAQEEMDRTQGYWWSPDDSMIAVERFDEAPVAVVSRAAIGADGTRVYDQRYPKAGTDNVLVDLYVLHDGGKRRVKVDLGENRDIYLARVDWAPDGKTLYVQRQSRDQKVLDMLAVDPQTGAASILFTEKAGERSWVNLSNAYRFLKDGTLVWWSERDGHGHLYRFDRGQWKQLTRGDWEVSGLVGIDERAGRIVFSGNKDGVLERHLYTVPLAGGEPVRLTEAGWWHGASGNGDASRMIVTRSNPDQPPQTWLADANGKRIAWVNENALDAAHPYFPYVASHRPKRFGTLKAADGTTLHWEMVTPVLEPGKRYPVFFQHYGGPHSQTVARQWSGALQQFLVKRGYIFFQIDNRGAANRGKAFEDHLYQAMGSVEVQDQLTAAQWLKTQAFVDPDAIVTYGWSYGGYMTLKMLEAGQGVFAGGISGAPVSKWELYDTHYTERYMGDPRQVAEAYKTSNTVVNAGKIADPLLLIHGMADDNVVLDHSTVMMAEMQKAAVPFELMLYPGQTHRVAGPGISEHLWTTILDFADRVTGRAAAKQPE